MKFHCCNKLIKMRKTLQLVCHEVSWSYCYSWGDLIGDDMAYRSPKLHTSPNTARCCNIDIVLWHSEASLLNYLEYVTQPVLLACQFCQFVIFAIISLLLWKKSCSPVTFYSLTFLVLSGMDFQKLLGEYLGFKIPVACSKW